MTSDDAWIEEAHQEILRARVDASNTIPPSLPIPDDLDAWERLCQWIARHPRRYLTSSALPPDLQGLLGPAGAATRATWQALHLLPLYEHPRYGWQLAQDWRERLARLLVLHAPHEGVS